MHFDRTQRDVDLMCALGEGGCRGAELCGFGDCQAQRSYLRTLVRADRIWNDEGACMRFYVVRAGLLATCAIAPDGRRQIISLNAPGDVVCPMSTTGAESWCEALADSEICEIDLSFEAERLMQDPAFVAALFRLAHDRVERAAAHVFALGRFDGMERVCNLLARMTRRTGRKQPSGWRVCLPMSREDIADYLGLNANTVSRLLTRVKKAGLVRFISLTEYEVPCLDRLEARVPMSLSGDAGRLLWPQGKVAS